MDVANFTMDLYEVVGGGEGVRGWRKGERAAGAPTCRIADNCPRSRVNVIVFESQ